MTQYLSPGVYVKEVPSGAAPIAGVGTSTAGFIGVVPDNITIPTAPLLQSSTGTIPGTQDTDTYELPNFRAELGLAFAEVHVDGVLRDGSDYKIQQNNIKFEPNVAINNGTKILVKSVYTATEVKNELVGFGDGTTREFALQNYPVYTDRGTFTVKRNGKTEGGSPVRLETGTDEKGNPITKIVFEAGEDPENPNLPPAEGVMITCDYLLKFSQFAVPTPNNEPRLCTSFSDFKKFFGDFAVETGQRYLAHAVYGFFNNGGTRCYVARVASETSVRAALEKFEAIDEIAIVALPGITNPTAYSEVIIHCQEKTGDRFAIFDPPEAVETDSGDFNSELLKESSGSKLPPFSNYAALYFPWIKVGDSVEKTQTGQNYTYAPPSGHIAGIYARVDAARGVHKAPANEPVLGALDLKYRISKAQQQGLNPQGVNCIRDLNGNIRVWGARTLGGDANGEFKYVATRRLFNFIKESIDEGLQWTVFEPNTPDLWAKIRRNVTAFLTNVWRDGALFGSTPQEAFFVKCDAETNPPEVRDAGQVVTKIGVAIVKPAEFVIFELSQWGGGS